MIYQIWRDGKLLHLRLKELLKNFVRDFDTNEKPNHEDIAPPVPNRFSLDVKKIIEVMDVNPFLQEDLVKISNVSKVYNHQAHLRLQALLINGKTQFTKFLNDRVINRNTGIDAPIKKIVIY